VSAPTVSVVLPTYNRDRLVGRAVRSVLAQTHREIELIVVDDGSTDATAAVLAEIDDARLVVLRLGGNRGASAARNAGLARARGSLVAFLDSDDVWHVNKLERQIAALAAASPRTGLCVCSMMVDRGGGWSYPTRWLDEEMAPADALRRVLSGVGYGTLSWLVRRDVLEAAGGFDESLPRLQDYELSIRIASGWGIRTMSEILATAELQSDSVSASADRYARAIDAIVTRHRPLFAQHRAGYSQMTFRAGKYLAIEGRCREAMPWFVRALRIRPANVRALAGAALCATGLFGVLRRIKYRR